MNDKPNSLGAVIIGGVVSIIVAIISNSGHSQKDQRESTRPPTAIATPDRVRHELHDRELEREEVVSKIEDLRHQKAMEMIDKAGNH